ncbi:MAG: hypothetical protein ACTSR8_08750 [Promethearchaeota archaeon]
MVASDDFDEFYTDFIKKFEELFGKVDLDVFNVDFFIVNERDIGHKNIRRNLDKSKGFKISYRKNPETGKPEIKINGEIDKNLLNRYLEYFKNNDLKEFANFNFKEYFDKYSIQDNRVLDASQFRLAPYPQGEDNNYEIEPYTEVNVFDSFSEIIIEAPGIDVQDVVLTLSEEGKKLGFSAQNCNRSYIKTVYLPFESDLENNEITINNGIVNLKIRRRGDHL